ncbi:carbon-nitrogen hydrolase family protein [Pseudaquabacterium rugosum]|uniref:Carbon-nitrogen hydrolase family protein n=1 Tax=Pseudaquabacterium rugosum TaxID=2984194 RepID=A0ABU9BG22_9BURK
MLNVAALQMVSAPDVAINLATACRLIAEAADQGARLLALPEYFCLMGQSDRDKLAIAEAEDSGPIQDTLAAAAQRHGVWIIGGTLPLRTEDPQWVRNSCRVWGPDGRPRARYDKIHLFAYDNGRGERYDEGRVLQAGDAPVAVEVDGWRVGLGICYDLRFPELFRALMQPAPCDLLVLPAAFTHGTGRAHWELLLRARAVENQCYVLAPAQGGLHPNGRRTWGHSLLADPWGEVLAVQAEGEGVVAGTLRRQRLDEVRAQLPALAHRRI